MIKNLKLNIKNAQLAEVLQRQPSPELESPVSKVRPKKAVAAAPTSEEPAKAQTAVLKPKPKADVAVASEETPAPAPKRARILRETPAPGVSEPVAKREEKTEEAKESAAPIFQEPIFDKPQEPSTLKAHAEIAPVKKIPQVAAEKKEALQEPAFTPSTKVAAPRSDLGQRAGQAPHAQGLRDQRPAQPSYSQNPRDQRPGQAPYGQGPRDMHRGATFTRQGAAPAPRPAGSQDRGFQPRDPNARPAASDRFATDRSRGYGDGPQRPRPDYRPGAPRPEGASGPRPGPADPNAPRAGAPFRRPVRPMEMRESFSDRQARVAREQQERFQQQHGTGAERPRLGPTGRHFRDLVTENGPATSERAPLHTDQEKAARAAAHGLRRKEETTAPKTEGEDAARNDNRARSTFDRSKPSKAIKKTVDRVRIDTTRVDEDSPWRKRRPVKRSKNQNEDLTVRPTSLHVKIPLLVKDLAQEMKLKASQLISKLFLQGIAVTLNDVLDDETTIQLLGQEFGCEITIDRKEDERIRITSKSVSEEIGELSEEESVIRPPIVAFMGHVDHGKTSLTDAIRKSNRVAGEAGAITQHIGAFSCHTDQGDLTILDTPGHEAFAAMRERGAQVTDVIVLVIAGDEGIKPQTDEAIRHAKEVKATILVAINKCDKPNFNADTVYRQLAERELLPEAWGGKTITVNCSAVTGEGLIPLLEMIALQAEVLELKANPGSRARGSVIEAELHKGLGNVATVLVQNGTLRHGDALVFTQSWGRVKTMRDEFGKNILEAKPSQAVRITGLSSLPEAGEDFIVVANEKEAREIAEARAHQIREKHAIATRKKFSMEALLLHGQPGKKIFNTILRADVQGSVEALRFELLKIKSDKIDIHIVSEGIGEISESDVQLAAASGALIIGFHSRIEAHAESLIKQHDVKVRCFDVIYHAVDGVRELMVQQLDKIAEEHPRGKAQVLAVFKSSQLGKIAGCQATEGTILRSYRARVIRAGSMIWEGAIASLKRGKEDVREVVKGVECGILLNGFNDWQVDDVIETYEIIYRVQAL